MRNEDFLRYYEGYKNKIFNYFWYRTGFDQELAEDLTSEVFLKAFEKKNHFDPSKSFGPWIFTIAHNHLVNFYKGQKIRIDFEALKNVFRQKEFLKGVEDKIEIEKLMELIKGLPEYYKEILTLRYIDQLEIKEIAEFLNKEEGTVRVAIHRALKELASLYLKQQHK